MQEEVKKNVTTSEVVSNNVVSSVGTNNTSNDKKSNKKKIILIIGIVLAVIIIIVVGFILLKGNDKKDNDKESNSNIESNSNNEEEKIQAKSLNVYKITSDDILYYSFVEENDEDTNSELYGTITCKTDECEPGDAFDNYVTIEEEDGAYLVDIKKNEIVYGPFGIILTEEDDSFDGNEKYNISYGYISSYDADKENTLLGVIISKNNKSTLYVAKTGKEYKNLNGELYETANIEHNKAIDYGYLILNTLTADEEDITGSYVYNLATGKLEGKYNSFIDTFIYNKKPYVMWYNDKKNEDVYTIKDIKGNTLFGGKKYTDTNIENSNLVIADNNYFYIYDKNLKLVKQSNKYNDIVMIGKDFVLVDNNHKLDLVDLNDQYLTTFINNYNEDKHFVHTMLSGWYTENKKRGIYIVVGQDDVDIKEVLKNNPDNTKEDLEGVDFGYEYYYIPSTKETGKIATYIGGYAKPVLYLYPEKTTKVKVGFKYPELLTTTYPKFNKYWNVTVDKNGNMTDKSGRKYYALYWEEASNKKVSFDTGFYVESAYAIKFLEEKLDYIGLTEREANEFIMYWLPILERNKKSLVYFELTHEREEFNKLLITPKPDSLLRVAIHIKKVNKKINIKEQRLTKFNRVGFSAVEWGGYLY